MGREVLEMARKRQKAKAIRSNLM